MSTAAEPGEGPFRSDAEFDAAAFRDVLDRAGYSAAAIKKLMQGVKSNEAVDRAMLERMTAEQTPFHTFARLFFLGGQVTRHALDHALAPFPIAQLINVGLVVPATDDTLRATAKIERYQELFVCSDFTHFTREETLARDHVLGLAPSALSLAALTPRRAMESVLDVATGGGIHALLASEHAQRVVATDICPRALNFAAMNVRLNGIENIELRPGSFFEPLPGERFELIIANPPFVISPRSAFIYRDGGLGGDAVSEHVVRGAAAHLEEGGTAVILVNWHHATEEDWADRPRTWTRDNGCDVRWMRFDDDDPLTYAASWLRQETRRDAAAATTELNAWIGYYEQAGISRLAMGAVVMRKRSGVRNWERCEHIPLEISLTACGAQIERIFDAEDLLHGLGAIDELLDQRLKLHPAHRLEQHLAVRDDGWSLISNKLHLTEGMDFCAEVDLPTMQFLGLLDGTRTVREAAGPVATAMGAELEQMVPICLTITERMLRIGLLVRA